jgi:hypothetical protein
VGAESKLHHTSQVCCAPKRISADRRLLLSGSTSARISPWWRLRFLPMKSLSRCRLKEQHEFTSQVCYVRQLCRSCAENPAGQPSRNDRSRHTSPLRTLHNVKQFCAYILSWAVLVVARLTSPALSQRFETSGFGRMQAGLCWCAARRWYARTASEPFAM